MSVIDNLEEIGRRPSGSATQVNGYDESIQVGPVNDFSRDFHSRERVVGLNTTPGIRESLPVDMQDDASGSVLSLEKPDLALGTIKHPASVVTVPASMFATMQYAVSRYPVQLAQPIPNRQSVTIQNISTNACYIGSNSAVTTTNGYYLAAGASITMNVTGEVWGVAVKDSDTIAATIEYMT